MSKMYPVTYIEHEDITVFVWDLEEGVQTIASCLASYPDKPIISVGIIRMTERRYDALDEYKGDC